jgi:hypothetical protein
LLHAELTEHVGFTECELRIKYETPLSSTIDQTNPDRVPGLVPISVRNAFRIYECEVSSLDDPAQENVE